MVRLPLDKRGEIHYIRNISFGYFFVKCRKRPAHSCSILAWYGPDQDKLNWHKARSVTPSVQEGMLYGFCVFNGYCAGSSTFAPLPNFWLKQPFLCISFRCVSTSIPYIHTS